MQYEEMQHNQPSSDGDSDAQQREDDDQFVDCNAVLKKRKPLDKKKRKQKTDRQRYGRAEKRIATLLEKLKDVQRELNSIPEDVRLNLKKIQEDDENKVTRGNIMMDQVCISLYFFYLYSY